jgi:hypothetical protein
LTQREINLLVFCVNFRFEVFKDWKQKMDIQTIKDRISAVQAKRERLLSLLEQPNLGTLRVDVNQALEELDDLLDEFKRTVPNA